MGQAYNARGLSIMMSAMQKTNTLSHNTTEPDQLLARTPHAFILRPISGNKRAYAMCLIDHNHC